MKKTLIALFGVSVFAGMGYTLWAFTPVGKQVLSRWLIRRWQKMAKRKGVTLDAGKLSAELAKLNYPDHELLFRYTLLDAFEKDRQGKLTGKTLERFNRLLKKMADSRLLERADLSELDNTVLPG